MKPKNFIWVALAVAIVGLGLWWFMRPTTAMSEKTSEAPMPAKANAPALSKVEAPKPIAPPSVAPLGQKPDTTPVAATQTPDPNADPQADLKTAISDIVRLYRTGDPVEVYKIYVQPDEFVPDLYQEMEEHEQQGDQIPELQQPTQELHDTIARSWEALEDQTPTFNATGDEAIYWKQGIIPSPDGGYAVGGNADSVTFIKINGKWYLKNGPF